MKNPDPDDPNPYSGMTVNERLFVSGTLDEYDIAMRRRDRIRAVELLRAVDIPEPERLVDNMLADPRRYGY